MPLPDVSRLDRLSPGVLARLAEGLRALGLTIENAAPVMSICEGLLDPLRRPLRLHHLRRRSDALALAMRAFLFGDPIPRRAALEALGALPLEECSDAGLLTEVADDAIVCPFALNLVGPLLVFSDDLSHGGDAVMGAAATTADLCRAARPRSRLRRALDVGCGAGTVALYLAAHVDRVVATDVNPRALALARANAALNLVENVEFRGGDLFEPVASEAFDLVVSQPPFVPRPRNSPEATYLYGGARGDELASRLLGQVAERLAPGGRAVVLVSWTSSDDTPLEARVRELVRDPALSVLVLAAPATDLDEWCSSHAALEARSLGAAFEARALELREHLEHLRIRAMRPAINVVVRGPEPSFTRRLDVLPLSRAAVSSAHVDALLATSALVDAPDERLLAADVCLPDGAEIVERNGRYRVEFADLLPPVGLSAPAAVLVAATDEAANVAEAVARALAKLGQGDEMTASALEGVRRSLALAILQAPVRAAAEPRRC